MSERQYELFRYQNQDGSSKDWAIRINGNGTYTKRWGKTGTRLVSKEFSMTHPDEVFNEKRAKERKGYRSIGMFFIDDDGNLSTVPPASSTSAGNNPLPIKEEPRIYWRIRLASASLRSKNITTDFPGKVFEAALYLHNVYPSEWIDKFLNEYDIMLNTAGQLSKKDGIASLFLLLLLKKLAPPGFTVSLSHEDGVEISDQLKLEIEALSFFDTDLETLRPIAEDIGLLVKRLDLSMIAPEQEDFFF